MPTDPADPSTFTPVTVVPPVEQFTFSLLLPDGWVKLETGPEQPDFSDLGAFLALAVFVHEPTMAVVSIAARPGYPEGAVLDWLGFAANQKGMNLEQFGPFPLASGGTGVSGLATQENDGGPTRFRAVAFEDGGNLFMLNAMAPVESWDAQRPLLDHVLASFTLVNAQGQTIPLRREEATEPAAPSVKTYATFALAQDAASLDPESPINAGIRDSGNGLVPRVLNVDFANACATVGAAAIMATFNVPLGWHVIDDARRTLVFDPGNQIQINFNLLALDPGARVDTAFQAILADLATENPEAQFQRFDLEGMPAMVVKGLVIGGERLEQLYVLKPIAPPDPRPNTYLKCRATTTAENFVRAGDLLELLLKDMKFVA